MRDGTTGPLDGALALDNRGPADRASKLRFSSTSESGALCQAPTGSRGASGGEGLFLCGASTPSGPGVAGVLRSGVAAASEVLEMDLLGPILAGRVFGDRSLLPELHDDWDPWRESH